jgi:two-component system OmpR family response regulator/two-component system response regulator QseB
MAVLLNKESSKMRILLIEDESLLGDGLQVGLRQLGFQVDWVKDGQAGLRELKTLNYDACILDLGLPQLDGIEVIAQARTQKITTPILVLTARNAIESKIEGFNLGADDYLIKPVDINELAARLRAISRRFLGHVQNELVIHDVALDASQRTVKYKNKLVVLSGKEFDVLHGLMLNAGRVLSRGQLEQRLYSWGHEVESNAVEVHIHHLRKKLAPELIQTVRGIGYTFQNN